MSDRTTVLVADADHDLAERTASALEGERESIVTLVATDAGRALELCEEYDVDCIVSGDGVTGAGENELLERVREDDPNLPFVLLESEGSETSASEQPSHSATWHYPAEGGDRNTLLTAQIVDAVSRYRAETERQSRRDELTLATIHETTRDLMRAETKREVYRIVTETAADILELQVAAVYAYRPTDGALDHAASVRTSPAFGDPDVTVTRNGGLLWDVFSAGETAYYEDLRRESLADGLDVPSRDALLVPLGTHGVLVVGTERVDGLDETMAELVRILATNAEAALDRAEREQLLREHDRTLTRQNEALTRLDHLNGIVRRISLGLAQATTRDAIERTVCEQLANTERYRFAWIASTETEPVEPTAWAGIDATYVDRLRDGAESAPETELARRALDSNRVQIVENVLETDRWRDRRTEAITYGYQTVVAVPLVADDRRYGALLVHVSGVDAVDGDERDVLAELGETIGHAVRSVEKSHVVSTDESVELELECHDSRLLLNRLSGGLDEPVSIVGTIEQGPEGAVAFVSMPATAEPETLESEWAAIDRLTVLVEREDELLCELTTTTPLLEVLSTYDARIRTAVSENGTASVTVTVPREVETRSLIEAIRERVPETELKAKRETTRTPPERRLEGVLEERLTERQFQALQTAYYSGFFEWPREATGEALADVLDVSAPTYHYHLRAAQRKLVALAFDDSR